MRGRMRLIWCLVRHCDQEYNPFLLNFLVN